VHTEVMVERVLAAVAARTDPGFVVVGRTDALAVEGRDAALERARHYVEAGADVIFLEGASSLEEYAAAVEATGAPILANITEFGVTPLFSLEALGDVGVSFVLYPLSAFRAMSAAALRVFDAIRREGSQAGVIDEMQTRADLYDVIDYEAYEARLNGSGPSDG
jgi:methylisocitrate lyase